jgi:hypothetical protein
MATPNQDAQDRLDLLREIELVNARILEMNRAAATASGEEKQGLEDRIAQHEAILRMNRDQLAVLNSVKKSTKANLTNFDSIDDTLSSIGSTLKNNSTLQNTFNTKLDAAKNTLRSVAAAVESGSFDDRQLKHIDAAGKAYAEMNISIATAASNLQNGRISQQEYNDIVKQSVKSFDDLLSLIDTSTQESKDLVMTFIKGRAEMVSFEKAAEKSTAALDAMNLATDQLGSSGIPLAKEFSNALGDIVNTGKLGKAALIALGAAAGKLAYDYFGAGTKASVKSANDVKQAQIDGAFAVATAQNELAFAAEQAASDFGFQLQSMAAQFNAASKTALFGKGLGSVGYAASQLQLAGISAETIATATSAASKSGSGSTKLAADMAIFAERSGLSVDNLANVQQAFKLLDGVSAGTALNMAEGTRAMADQAGLNVGDIMNEVASASEMALSYQIQSGNALARQVVYAKSLGVSFNEVAKAGQDMVLNYKDSIKAEMSLSAMLGKNVDLSQVRAKFASGDTEGALESLRAQGLDPSQMNMFQQQQLQQATGGMDLNTLKKIATPGFQEGVGTVGTLEEKSAKASNEAFLALKQNSAAALATQEALISGQKAVQDAALSAIKDVTLKSSDAYKQYLTDLAQLDIERMFSENIGGAISAGIGGLTANFLPDIFKKMFKGGGAAPAPTVVPPPPPPLPPGGRYRDALGRFTRRPVPTPPVPPGGGNVAKFAKFGKVAKVGGSVLSGVLGSIDGYFTKKEEGGSTGEAVGAGALQGTTAVGGAALGGILGSVIPGLGTAIGAMIGGFLGDALGGWINEYAPGVSEMFGKVWDSVGVKFNEMKEKVEPVLTAISNKFNEIKGVIVGVYDKVNQFMIGLGFEEGLGSIFSTIAEFVGTNLMQPFNILLAGFGFLFDIIGGLAQLTYDWDGGLATLKQGFLDFMHAVFAPMTGLFETVYNGFAKMWNGIADSYIGEQMGLGKMEQKDFSGAAAKAMNQTETAKSTSVSTQIQQKAAVEANKPVVAATTATTKVAEESAAHQAAMAKEMTYTGNAQSKMVALLGASAMLLEQIVYNTAGERTISLDGAVLNKKLFDNSNKTYGLART